MQTLQEKLAGGGLISDNVAKNSRPNKKNLRTVLYFCFVLLVTEFLLFLFYVGNKFDTSLNTGGISC